MPTENGPADQDVDDQDVANQTLSQFDKIMTETLSMYKKIDNLTIQIASQAKEMAKRQKNGNTGKKVLEKIEALQEQRDASEKQAIELFTQALDMGTPYVANNEESRSKFKAFVDKVNNTQKQIDEEKIPGVAKKLKPPKHMNFKKKLDQIKKGAQAGQRRPSQAPGKHKTPQKGGHSLG